MISCDQKQDNVIEICLLVVVKLFCMILLMAYSEQCQICDL